MWIPTEGVGEKMYACWPWLSRERRRVFSAWTAQCCVRWTVPPGRPGGLVNRSSGSVPPTGCASRKSLPRLRPRQRFCRLRLAVDRVEFGPWTAVVLAKLAGYTAAKSVRKHPDRAASAGRSCAAVHDVLARVCAPDGLAPVDPEAAIVDVGSGRGLPHIGNDPQRAGEVG
jgi:hypothetical protein